MGKFALILIISLTLIMAASSIAVNQIKNQSNDTLINFYSRNISQNLANSYANIYINRIHSDTSWTPNWNEVSIEDGVSHTREIEDGTNITLIKRSQTTNSIFGIKGQYEITSIANVNSVICSTVVIDNSIPYSYYAWFLNRWPSSLYLGNREGVKGPVFSNQYVTVGQTPGPLIDGNISTVKGISYKDGLNESDWRNETDPDAGFKGDWIKEGVDPIPFDKDAVMLSDEAKDGAVDLDNLNLDYSNAQHDPSDNSPRLHVTFLENGEVMVSTHRFPNDLTPAQAHAYKLDHDDKIVILDSTQIDNLTDENGKNILYSSSYDISVKGTVSGQFTISNEHGHTVEIEGDIVYNDDPRDNPSSTDLLSIMSYGDINIATDEVELYNGDPFIPNNNNDGDVLETMANLTSLGKIVPENYKHCGARGTWLTYGSRIQKGIGATWTGESNYDGFKEFIEYDGRFRSMAPPGMQYTTNRRILSYYETL